MFVTDAADQAVILPLTVTTFVVLLAQRRWRVAAAWAATVPGVLGTLLVLKAIGYACGWLLPELGPNSLALRSPSGHVASAAMICGGIFALQAGRRRLSPLLMALTAAFTAAIIIGTTRIRLGAHSIPEVIAGAVIGGVGCMAFAWLGGRNLREQSGLPAAAAALAVLTLCHGLHLPAEAAIQSAEADILLRWVPACQPEHQERDQRDPNHHAHEGGLLQSFGKSHLRAERAYLGGPLTPDCRFHQEPVTDY